MKRVFRKGAMELEYMAKMIIIVIVIFVVISILLTSSSSTSNKLMNLFQNKEEDIAGVHITRDTIDESILADYIYSCFNKNQNHEGDSVCYVIELNNTLNSLDDNLIRENLYDKNIGFTTSVNPGSSSIIIEYHLLGNSVSVSSLG